MSTPERAVVWLRLARGGRRAVEVGIDPAEVDRALAKWQRLLGSARRLEVSRYPARPDAGPPNPVNRPGVDGGSDSWKGSEHAQTPQVPT